MRNNTSNKPADEEYFVSEPRSSEKVDLEFLLVKLELTRLETTTTTTGFERSWFHLQP
jgi:hypothetical protein